MEPIMGEGDWSSLSGMYNNTEEADFMTQLLNNCDLGDGSGNVSSIFWPNHESSTMDMVGVNNNEGSFCFSQGSSSYSGGSSVLFPNSSQESYYLTDISHQVLVTNDNSPMMSMDFSGVGDATNTSSYLIDGHHECSFQEMSDGNVEDQSGGGISQLELSLPVNPKREFEMQAPEPVAEDKLDNPSQNSKKRTRSSTNADVQKNKRNVKSKKNQKTVVSTSKDEDDDNNNNVDLNRATSSSCFSEDDSNGSHELNGGGGETSSLNSKGKSALNLNGKTRASRGSATDPQSLYARKRRERINERLRILQNLVPNGTKVDISTMLEEAVQYVKFLQLQIKLLSSDDLWMYSPIAYNGMNIGLLDPKVMTAPR